ncbi:ALP1-like protein [Tanacetum coccineum]
MRTRQARVIHLGCLYGNSISCASWARYMIIGTFLGHPKLDKDAPCEHPIHDKDAPCEHLKRDTMLLVSILDMIRCSLGDHGSDPFILLEARASQDLWIWHAFFGVSGLNNDVNVLWQSPIFTAFKSGKASEVPFVANEVTYKRGYYLSDGIYPEWFVLIKSISNPGSNDHKRIMYKTVHEAAQKDVERAFGVLKWK